MERTEFIVGLDDQTVALLMEAAATCRCSPRDLIASIVSDVLLDDARAHGEIGEPIYLN